MPKLYYYTWKSTDKIIADYDPLLTTNPHWADLRTRENDVVFVFGGLTGNDAAFKNLDDQNIAVVKREFKLLNLEKKNRMVDVQVTNINNGKPGAQNQRTRGIVDLNTFIISDFLRYLDKMLWEDKINGIRSTISFDDAYDLVKPVFQDLLNISATIIDDTYNNAITDKEISDAVEKSKLKQEQITSSEVVKTRTKKKKRNKKKHAHLCRRLPLRLRSPERQCLHLLRRK